MSFFLSKQWAGEWLKGIKYMYTGFVYSNTEYKAFPIQINNMSIG